MGTRIRCFLIEPTGRYVRSLRRYRMAEQPGTRDCPGRMGYHDAMAPLDVVGPFPGVEWPKDVISGDRWPHDDPRWPAACDGCSYTFLEDDIWQLFTDREYARADTGELCTLRTAGVGAMWWAPWLAGHHAGNIHRTERGNGPHLVVKTPGGDWDIDAPATNTPDGWHRRGDPPDVVAWASIQIDGYHGFLGGGAKDQPGYLVEC